MRDLAGAAWPEVETGPAVLVPVGSTEQHGPHLPLSTDTVIARAVAERAADLLDGGALVAPALPYGASGEHAGFPGTISIGRDALELVLVETVRSLALWAGRVVFVNGHGGNAAALDAAAGRMRAEGHEVGWVGCGVPGGDAHAGFTETSIMLYLAPELVRASRGRGRHPADRRAAARAGRPRRPGGVAVGRSSATRRARTARPDGARPD
ncbi:mycofactocin system creatininase family protein, partial [Actinomadura sp. CNU-125]|uniref:mycofactocin biosynthesis peptidyl-dipeptidase MftE n=1 Tax=Actinomadura sp. CNU-125 TaxID=1904961 RepID=UPI000966BF32